MSGPERFVGSSGAADSAKPRIESGETLAPANDQAGTARTTKSGPNDICGMTRKEKFDCCAKQAELAFNSFNARREHQFKITLGLWALLLLTTQFVLIKPQIHPNSFVCVGIAVLLVGIHTSFVCGIWLKKVYDEQIFFYFRRKCAELDCRRQLRFSRSAATFDISRTVEDCAGRLITVSNRHNDSPHRRLRRDYHQNAKVTQTQRLLAIHGAAGGGLPLYSMNANRL